MPVRIPATSRDENGARGRYKRVGARSGAGPSPIRSASHPLCAGQGGCPTARVLCDVRQERHERHQLDGRWGVTAGSPPGSSRGLSVTLSAPHVTDRMPAPSEEGAATGDADDAHPVGNAHGGAIAPDRPPTTPQSLPYRPVFPGWRRSTAGFRSDPAGSVTMEVGPKSSNCNHLAARASELPTRGSRVRGALDDRGFDEFTARP
jgi:hypothetical protein